MAVTFFPFNSIVVDGVPDRPANAENLAAYLAGFFSNGVLMQTDTALKVEASSGMNVQIHAGMGNINGKTILADAAEIITLDTASASLARIDRVVFRLDEVNRLMEFDVLKGTPASSPTAPALTQGADVYELCLAEIRVPAGASSILASYITDTRADADFCGVASIAPHMQDLGHGGTGISAETEKALLLALGGIGIELVWENAAHTSDFPEQDIEFARSEASHLLILAKDFASSDDLSSVILPNEVGRSHVFTYIGASLDKKYWRRMEIIEDGVKAWKGTYAQGTAVDAQECIPYQIYIIEGVA